MKTKTITLFTKDDGDGTFLLKVYRDTVTSPQKWVRYRSSEQRAAAIDQTKKEYDNLKTWQSERRAKRSNPENSCSASIKKELHDNFPGVKFSVTSGGGRTSDSVRVCWTDGPTTDQVKELTGKYERGYFDGMTDMYEYTNRRDDIPQTNYVFEVREMSSETREILTRDAQKWIDHGHDYSTAGCHDAGTWAHRLFCKTPIPVGATVVCIERNEETCGLNDVTTFFRVVIQTVNEPNNNAPQTNYEKVDTKAGEINIVDYSEKSFAVIGDTKPIKDLLSDLKGSWNPRLSCGPGWIFSKKRLQSVQEAIAKLIKERKAKPIMELLPPDKAAEVRDEWNKMDDFLKTLSA